MARVVFLLKSDKLLGKPNNDYSNKFLNETSPDQFVLLVQYFFFLLKYLHIFGAKQEKVKAVVAKSFFYFCRSVQCMYPFSGHFDVFWISGSLKNNETYSYRV